MVNQSQFISQFGDSSIPKVELSSLCTEFLDGDWIESKDQSDSGYRLVQTGNVGNGEYIDKSGRARFVSDDTFKRLNCTEIHPGDILFSRLPEPLGRCCILPVGFPKAITAVDCTIARLGEKCLPEFLVVYTSTELYSAQVNKCVTGTTRQRISRNNLAKILVPCPDIKEQQLFVQFAQQADKSKFAGFKSQFIEKFGPSSSWPKEELYKNVEEMFIGPFGSSLKNDCFVEKEKGYCVVYEQKHAIEKSIELPFRYVTHDKYQELKRFEVLPGDIIVSCRGTVGEVYRIPDNAPRGIMHPSIMKIRLKKESFCSEYFVFAVAEYMKDRESKNLGTGVKMAVTATDMGKELFTKPSVTEQNSFISIIHHADKSKYLN